jgi:hypothetical protein
LLEKSKKPGTKSQEDLVSKPSDENIMMQKTLGFKSSSGNILAKVSVTK